MSCVQPVRPVIPARRMAAQTIQVGDRVVNLQVPGIFHVIARRGALVEIETEQGLRLTVNEAAVRKLDDEPPPTATEV
jgi:hypothetical protein